MTEQHQVGTGQPLKVACIEVPFDRQLSNDRDIPSKLIDIYIPFERWFPLQNRSSFDFVPN
jgi:hypothetical protein